MTNIYAEGDEGRDTSDRPGENATPPATDSPATPTDSNSNPAAQDPPQADAPAADAPAASDPTAAPAADAPAASDPTAPPAAAVADPPVAPAADASGADGGAGTSPPAPTGPCVALSVAPKDPDGQSHLSDSLQLEIGLSAVLSWAAQNANSVELTGPDGVVQAIADGSTTLVVTPTGEVNDYAMVAIAGEQRSPMSQVQISTHLPGQVYSPHTNVLPPNTPPDIDAFHAVIKGSTDGPAAALSAMKGATLTLSWEVVGVVRKIEIDGIGDVTQYTDSNQDSGSGTGSMDVVLNPIDGQAQVVYLMTLTPADVGLIPVVQVVTVTVIFATVEEQRYDYFQNLIEHIAGMPQHAQRQGGFPNNRVHSGEMCIGADALLFDTRDLAINIFGICSMTDWRATGLAAPGTDVAVTTDKWDDWMVQVWVEGGKKRCVGYAATVDPGVVSDADLKRLHCTLAHLNDGHYRYRLGTHGDAPAGKPNSWFSAWSDADHSGVKTTNDYWCSQSHVGTDLHYGSGTPKIYVSSVGCQVVRSSSSRDPVYVAFIGQVQKATNQTDFPYTLIDSSLLPGAIPNGVDAPLATATATPAKATASAPASVPAVPPPVAAPPARSGPLAAAAPLVAKGLSPFIIYAIGREESGWGNYLKGGTGDEYNRWMYSSSLNGKWYKNPTGRKVPPLSMNGASVVSSGTSPACTVKGRPNPGISSSAAVSIQVTAGGGVGAGKLLITVDGTAGSELTLVKGRDGAMTVPLTGNAAGFRIIFKLYKATYVAGETYTFNTMSASDLANGKYPDDVTPERVQLDKLSPQPYYNSERAEQVEVGPPALPCASIPSPSPGFGYGLMQMDIAGHWDWLNSNDWGDPGTIVMAGVDLFLSYRKEIASKMTTPLSSQALTYATICAYNGGLKGVIAQLLEDDGNTHLKRAEREQRIDNHTFGKDYGTKVTRDLEEVFKAYKPPAGEPAPTLDDESTLVLSSDAAKAAFRAALKTIRGSSSALHHLDVMLAVGAQTSV
jgi:hypothetical protein